MRFIENDQRFYLGPPSLADDLAMPPMSYSTENYTLAETPVESPSSCLSPPDSAGSQLRIPVSFRFDFHCPKFSGGDFDSLKAHDREAIFELLGLVVLVGILFRVGDIPGTATTETTTAGHNISSET
jgi:hypothetical protein